MMHGQQNVKYVKCTYLPTPGTKEQYSKRPQLNTQHDIKQTT